MAKDQAINILKKMLIQPQKAGNFKNEFFQRFFFQLPRVEDFQEEMDIVLSKPKQYNVT